MRFLSAFLLSLSVVQTAEAADVLIYGPSDYRESSYSSSDGHSVTVWDTTQWAAATQADFEAFDVIVVGDKDCSGPSATDLQTLYDTRNTWGPAVTGNVFVTGTDAICHYSSSNSVTFYNQAVDWASSGGATGAFISGDWGRRNLDYLSPWGAFSSVSQSGDTLYITDLSHPTMTGFSTSSLNNWGSTYHSYISSYPSDFTPIVVQGSSSSGNAMVVVRDAVDQDGDGYGPSDDCDDSDSSVYPGATEYCDGVDNNCDGTVDEDSAVDALTWYEDADGDTYGNASSTDTACTQPTGYVSDNTDCDDSDANTNPAADEYCGGGDEDCDGTVDEDSAVDAFTWYADSDADSYGDASVSDVDCVQPVGYVSDSSDCDDTDANTNPGASEYCDGHDDDCDGFTDEDSAVDAMTWYRDADMDGYGNASVTDVECYRPTGYVADSSDCDDTDSATYPGSIEYCGGGDEDCDGTVDEDDAADASTWYADSDGDGFGNASVTDVECVAPMGYVADSTDCDDTSSTTYPGADEYCDGHDDDCDGITDEDDSMDAITWYVDSDGDGEGDPTVSADSCYGATGYVQNNTDCDDSDVSLNTSDGDGDGYTSCESDCNDTDNAINIDATEIWYDGVDQNCDGWSDYDQDGDGFDSIDYNGDDCDDEDDTINLDATEIWYDGVDQDCDTLSDYDADYDGQDSESYGGEDCDDADPDTYAGAPDTPYDGIITDCLNANDYDADGDGVLAEEYGGTDCDDANSEVNPGAEEIWYDGIDQDCDGNDDDQDGDGVPMSEDCDDEDETVFEDCDTGAGSDTGVTGGDTGDTGISGSGKDDGACACSSTSRSTSAPWLLGLLGLALFRRRNHQA